ncbi:unnamed protein product [marine sediment metagenome]|uniref:Arrestin-like N-terminal domain-containing protein n=1 Tax=marine sediment metagenome TaxID=412755 RepID=X1BX93_9ZZZZ
MAKFVAGYEIQNPPSMLYPNDELSGVINIRYEGKKEKRIKRVELQCHEKYEYMKWSKLLDEYEQKSHDKTLAKWVLSKDILIQPGEMKTFPFKIKMPSMWKPKAKSSTSDWHMALTFVAKAGALQSGTLGYIVLPVYGSMRPPSFGPQEVPQIKAEPIQQQTQTVVVNISKDESQGNGATEKIETKFCSLCGKKIKKEAVYCEHCGGKQ